MFLRKQCKICCNLEKISRSPDARNLVCARVIYSLNSGRCTTHCFRYTGKNIYYLAHIRRFKNCVAFNIQSKSQIWSAFYLALKLYSCYSYWISSYNIDNLWQYYICLEFAVSVILWPYEMRSRLQNQFHFLPKIHSYKFIHNSLTGLGDHYFA